MVQYYDVWKSITVTTLFPFVASSSDFSEGVRVVWFWPWHTKAIVYIHINNDNIAENTEAFEVDLLKSHYSYNKGIKFGRNPKAIVYIKDGESTDHEITISLV